MSLEDGPTTNEVNGVKAAVVPTGSSGEQLEWRVRV